MISFQPMIPIRRYRFLLLVLAFIFLHVTLPASVSKTTAKLDGSCALYATVSVGSFNSDTCSDTSESSTPAVGKISGTNVPITISSRACLALVPNPGEEIIDVQCDGYELYINGTMVDFDDVDPYNLPYPMANEELCEAYCSLMDGEVSGPSGMDFAQYYELPSAVFASNAFPVDTEFYIKVKLYYIIKFKVGGVTSHRHNNVTAQVKVKPVNKVLTWMTNYPPAGVNQFGQPITWDVLLIGKAAFYYAKYGQLNQTDSLIFDSTTSPPDPCIKDYLHSATSIFTNTHGSTAGLWDCREPSASNLTSWQDYRTNTNFPQTRPKFSWVIMYACSALRGSGPSSFNLAQPDGCVLGFIENLLNFTYKNGSPHGDISNHADLLFQKLQEGYCASDAVYLANAEYEPRKNSKFQGNTPNPMECAGDGFTTLYSVYKTDFERSLFAEGYSSSVTKPNKGTITTWIKMYSSYELFGVYLP